MAGDVSDESEVFWDLGTFMYLEPSLFVYFAVALKVGEVGDWAVCGRWFAGIPIQCGRVSQHGRAATALGAEVSY